MAITYENIFFGFVLDPLRDMILAEYSGVKVYIAPEILHPDNFQVRIWGESAVTDEVWLNSWQKEYTSNVYLYLISKNPDEEFYKQLYADGERAYQLLQNNKTKSKTIGSTTLTWINGRAEDMIVNDLEGDEEDIDGLNVAKLTFTCLVEKEG